MRSRSWEPGTGSPPGCSTSVLCSVFHEALVSVLVLTLSESQLTVFLLPAADERRAGRGRHCLHRHRCCCSTEKGELTRHLLVNRTFLRLDLLVRVTVPLQGSAVFWFNLYPSGEGDYRTRHAACPVLLGNKWGEFCLIPEKGFFFSPSYVSVIHIIAEIGILKINLYLFSNKYGSSFLHAFSKELFLLNNF